MSIFENMMDAAFSTDMGEPAIYTPVGGDAVSIIVVPRKGDVIDQFQSSRIRTDNRALFDVRKSEIAVPDRDAVIVHSGASYRVKSWSSDDDNRLVWTIECYPDE